MAAGSAARIWVDQEVDRREIGGMTLKLPYVNFFQKVEIVFPYIGNHLFTTYLFLLSISLSPWNS